MISVFNRFNCIWYWLKAAFHTFIISASSPSDDAVCAISSVYGSIVVLFLGCGDFSDHLHNE